MTDILDLPGWKATSKCREEDEYVIKAEYTIQPGSCQKCGVIGKLYKHGTKDIAYRDSPIRGAPVNILASVQRYKCRDCGETFLQPLGSIQPDMRMTRRCVEFIQSQCLRDTFLRIAEHVGCDDKTVRSLAGDHIAKLNAEYKPYLPEWMGIDETQIDGVLRCIIADVGNNRPIDMLADREKTTVVSWLHRFKDRGVVKGLAIDMWHPYKDAARSVFPGLPVVIDKFHVVRMANSGLEKVRVRLAKTKDKVVGRDWMRRKALLRMRYANLDEKGKFGLQMWMDNEPEIAVAYRIKEAFYDIYDCKTRQEAELALDAWHLSIPKSLKTEFKELDRAATNWRTEILAIFDYPISNGYTEALNGVAKVVNRQGRGYGFDVLRARILFGRKAGKSAQQPPAPLVQVTARGVRPPLRELLIAKYEHRCQSCGGVYDQQDLHVTRMGPLLDGEPMVNNTLMCGYCKERFHTDGVIHHGPLSTP